jgi:PAS domain S-box-containing protein
LNDDRIATLTPREREVLGYIGQGLTLAEIADKLFRSLKTIETHRLSLGRKLGANNRVQLAKIAISAGMATLDPGGGPGTAQAVRVASSRAPTPEAESPAAGWSVLQQVHEDVGGVTGGRYLRELACSLTERLKVRSCVISQLMEDDHTVRVLVLCDRGDLIDDLVAPRDQCICDVTLSRGFYFCPGEVSDQHPGDPILDRLDATAYMGVALNNEDRQLGVLAILNASPIDLSLQPDRVLQLLAPRLGSELDRIRMVERLHEFNQTLEDKASQRAQQLAECNQLHRTLVETMTDGICLVDRDGRITLVNQQFAQMAGMTQQQLLGRDVHELMLEEDAQRYRAMQPQREKPAPRAVYRLRLKRPDSTVRPILIAPRSLFDEQGEYSGSFGVVTDLTKVVDADQAASGTTVR